MNTQVRKLLSRGFQFCLPLIALLLFYVVADPFKLLYNYSNYYQPTEDQHIGKNRDFVSTEMLLKNYPLYHYDSFILGSSRSLFYDVKVWNQYTHSDRSFHFDGSGESLYGITQKVKFLHDRNIPIKNALVVIDTSLLIWTHNHGNVVFCKHPLVSHENMLLFQIRFLKNFLQPKFLMAYFDLKLTHRFKPYMDGVLRKDATWDYDVKYNQLWEGENEALIARDSMAFYTPRMKRFYQRSGIPKMSTPVIGEKQKQMLGEIEKIFREDSTDFRIIISPLYDQVKINDQDVAYLQSLFGVKNVFDFSGINEITNNMFNYYEESHYRPRTSAYIMRVAYGADSVLQQNPVTEN